MDLNTRSEKKKSAGDIALKAYKENPCGSNLLTLFAAYRPLIQTVINRFSFNLLDEDDLIQEAQIVCFKAAQTYQESFNTKYGTYFIQCLINRYNSLTRFDGADKRRNQKRDLSLEMLLEAGEEKILGYISTNEGSISDELNELIIKQAPVLLSKFELRVFKLKILQDYSAAEIAEILEVTPTAVYNALGRCHRKLESYIQGGDYYYPSSKEETIKKPSPNSDEDNTSSS